MATYTVVRAKHATLSGSTVDTVKITGPMDRVEVTNRSTSGTTLTVTHDGTVPTTLADDTDFVMPGTSLLIEAPQTKSIQILGNGNDYSVVAVQP